MEQLPQSIPSLIWKSGRWNLTGIDDIAFRLKELNTPLGWEASNEILRLRKVVQILRQSIDFMIRTDDE